MTINRIGFADDDLGGCPDPGQGVADIVRGVGGKLSPDGNITTLVFDPSKIGQERNVLQKTAMTTIRSERSQRTAMLLSRFSANASVAVTRLTESGRRPR